MAELYDSKLRIAEQLLQQWVQDHPDLKLPVAFDSWYTQPAFCHYLDKTLGLSYVGALAEDDEVVLKTGQERLGVFAARLKQEHLDAAMQALANATPRLRDQARDQFLAACALPDGEDGWQMFLSLAGELLPRAANPALLPLFRRAAETPDTRAALESVLALIASRPLRTWTDLDTDRFRDQAQYLGELIRTERLNENGFDRVLTPDQILRSQQIASDMRHLMANLQEAPKVLRAALHLLDKELQQRNPIDLDR